MKKLISWIKSKFKKLKKLYVLVEINLTDKKIENEYYFQNEQSRIFVYNNLLMLEFSEHFKMWCQLREYPINEYHWYLYLDTTKPFNKYVFLDEKVSEHDARYTLFSYEEIIKNETEKFLVTLEEKLRKMQEEKED
jgi:hypothetical protein